MSEVKELEAERSAQFELSKASEAAAEARAKRAGLWRRSKGGSEGRDDVGDVGDVGDDFLDDNFLDDGGDADETLAKEQKLKLYWMSKFLSG